MKKNIPLFAAALLLLGATGCQYYARSAEDYKKATEDLLETKKGELKQCYDEVLKSHKKAKGTVTVNFTVEAKTGQIGNVEVDKDATTAPDSLSQCVVNAMSGLVLDPPDQRTGKASFSYEFAPNK